SRSESEPAEHLPMVLEEESGVNGPNIELPVLSEGTLVAASGFATVRITHALLQRPSIVVAVLVESRPVLVGAISKIFKLRAKLGAVFAEPSPAPSDCGINLDVGVGGTVIVGCGVVPNGLIDAIDVSRRLSVVSAVFGRKKLAVAVIDISEVALRTIPDGVVLDAGAETKLPGRAEKDIPRQDRTECCLPGTVLGNAEACKARVLVVRGLGIGGQRQAEALL